MSQSGGAPRRRYFWKYLLVIVSVVLLSLCGLLWYTTTDSFQEMVRHRLIGEIDRITGGHAEVGGFHTQPLQFEVEIRDLTVHGREAKGEIPFAHVDHLVAHIKLVSILGAELGFRSVVLEHPVVHLIFYPDGSSNQPRRDHLPASGKSSVEALFSLSINRFDVRHGEVLLYEQKLPFDFVAHDVSADMSYSLLHGSYEGNLLLGKVSTRFKDYRPIAWTAETHFALSQNGIEVRTFKATSGRSKIEASGRLLNFGSPTVIANYDVALDLAEASVISRNFQAAAGTLEAKGRGVWSTQSFSSSGKLQVKSLDWNRDPIIIHQATATADFLVTPKRISISGISGRALSGSVVGDAEITNWLSPALVQKVRRSSKADEQIANLRLNVKELSVAEALAAIFPRQRYLGSFHLAGAVSGTFGGRWTGSPDKLELDTALDVTPSAEIQRGQLPVAGHLNAGYQASSQQWQIFNLVANTRASQVRAAGAVSNKTSLTLMANTSDLDEWQPLVQAFGNRERIPVVLHGHASFSGKATGKVSDLLLAGKLAAQDFNSPFLPRRIASTAIPNEQRIHWDYLALDLQFSEHRFAAHNGILRQGAMAIGFELDTDLRKGSFAGSLPFTAKLGLRRADVAEVLQLAGYEYPLTGMGDISLQASGTWLAPAGNGRVHLANAIIRGEKVESFDSEFSFDAGQLFLRNLVLKQREASVSGEGSYKFDSHEFRFNLTGSNFDLSRIAAQQSRMQIEGRVDFAVHLSGTLQQPAINGNLKITNLLLDHERAGDFLFTTTTQGSVLHLAGRSQFTTAELSLDGDITLRDNWPGKVNAHFSHLDFDSLLRLYVHGGITGHSTVEGDLEMEGPFLRPRELTATGNLTDVNANVENIKLRNHGPLKFAISSEELKVKQFHFVGEGTDISGAGSVQLTGQRALDFRAQGKINLQLIESFNPDFTSSGVVAVDVVALGTASNPAVQGKVQVINGAIAYINLPSAFSDINGSLSFNQNRLQIEALTAHTGGGTVTVTGQATTYNRQLNFDVSAKGQGVRVRYPPGVSSTADADLHFAGSSSASTLSGDITITKLGVTPGFDFGAYLARSAQASSLPQTNPTLNRIRLDLHITTVPELQMQTAALRLSGDADLHLRGTAGKPVLLGRADVIEGEAYFNGTKYRLERGDVTFTSPVSTTPVLDLQAFTHVRDYDITLNLNGEVDKPSVTYRSEPPLPTADIIALLAFGQTTVESAQLQQSGQSAFTQQASSAILTEALNATINNRVQRLFGVSRIKIDPQGLATETTPIHTGPAVTIEQQVKDNLTITYSTNVAQTSQQIIQAEYNVTRNVSIVGIRDQNGVVSLSVRVRQRKK
ncbi:MAG: translocation/assembly module TamB domain-containing protein [Acidobacteriota bacterium]|nr:translocation/assembly module TamB domain-containing protein [Acidobacteriota bacterium]